MEIILYNAARVVVPIHCSSIHTRKSMFFQRNRCTYVCTEVYIH